MKKLACKDIDPTSSCEFEVSGANAKEVAAKMLDHVKEKHMDVMKGKSDSDMLSMLEAKAHD